MSIVGHYVDGAGFQWFQTQQKLFFCFLKKIEAHPLGTIPSRSQKRPFVLEGDENQRTLGGGAMASQ